MNKKKALISLAAAVVIIGLFAGASALYNLLSERYFQPELAVTGTTSASDAGAVSDSDSVSLTPAPDFLIYDGNKEPVTLADFAGKPMIVNFWASRCVPCREEKPALEAAYKEYGEEIQFLMVSLTDGVKETRESADKYVAKFGYTFPVYYDEDRTALHAFNVFSSPMTFFIDAEGNIVSYYSGTITEELLNDGIAMILPEE